MEGQALKDGRERVRVHLIDYLEHPTRGMVRKPGVSVTEHAAFIEALQNRLAYMTADNLDALAEQCVRYAGGKHRNRWPGEVSIVNWAARLQMPPGSVSRLVRTYLQSAAGQAAMAGGYEVELYDYLRAYGVPSGERAFDLMRDEAVAGRGRRARVRREAEAGMASPSEVAELEAFYRKQGKVRGIITAGQEVAQA
ncbi:hypothetical protein [Marinovum algicola]|uniref:hypothetical protein n=1 Tax=Marinovum algicola TaxID=42444 RepID=UPI003B52D17A